MTYSKLILFGLFTFCFVRGLYCGHLKFWHVEVSYDDARNMCLNDGSYLVKINNQSKFDTVIQLANAYKADFWIGLRLDTTQLPLYHYIHGDGDSASFLPWDVYGDEPDEQDTQQCIRVHYIKENKMKYRTRDCTRSEFFVCEQYDTVQDITTTLLWSSDAIEGSSMQTTDSSKQISVSLSTSVKASLDTTTMGGSTMKEVTTSTVSLTSFPDMTCMCLCNNSQNLTVDTRLEEIRSALYIDRKVLARHVRTLECATDQRFSSSVLGLTGASVIVSIILLIIVGDMISLLKVMALSICRHT